MTAARDVSVPSNLSGSAILILSVGVGIVVGVGVGVLVDVRDSVCLRGSVWDLWTATVVSVVMPRACNSLERGILTFLIGSTF